MTLLKTVGILWALLAMVMYSIINRNYKNILIPSLSGLGVFGIWKAYCILMERNSYYSSDILHTIKEIKWNGIRPLVEDLIMYAKSYCCAFVKEPLNCSSTSVLNVVPVLFVILFIIFIIWMTKKKIYPNREGKVLVISYVLAQVVFTLTLILMCSFVFRENQFKEPGSMIYLIARYGANFYLGALLFIILFVFELWPQISNKKKCIVASGFVTLILACSDFSNVHNLVDNNEEIKMYVKVKNDEIVSRYNDALTSDNKEAILVENADDDSLHGRYFYIQYVGTPMKLIIEQTTPESLEQDIVSYKERYGTENIYTYGF